MFCGALPPEGGGPLGSEVVKVWEIDPPKDLNQYLYRCDDHFHVDILKDMLKDDNLIGFLAIDAKDAGWGLLHGDKIEVSLPNRFRSCWKTQTRRTICKKISKTQGDGVDILF